MAGPSIKVRRRWREQVARFLDSLEFDGRAVFNVRTARAAAREIIAPEAEQAREWPGDRRAPMGRPLARLGRRVLEALEGQPDACEACRGAGFISTVWEEPAWTKSEPRMSCPDCHGTGDNLRGVLPEAVETAQERHRAHRGVNSPSA